MRRLLVALAMVAYSLRSFAAYAETVVYVSIAAENRIAVYAMDDSNGNLRHVSDMGLNAEPGPLATDPAGKFLFASVRSAGDLASFRRSPSTGELTPVSRVAAGADPAYVATDHTGRFLLSAYYRAGKVAVHRIGDDGSLADQPLQDIDTDDKAHAIVLDRTNRFVMVPHTGPNAIFQFQFNAKTGRLTPNTVPRIVRPENTGPRHLGFHPTLDTAYVSDEQGNSITAYEFDANQGRLTALQTLSTLPAGFARTNSTAHMEIHPSGKWVYVANRGHDSLAGFRIDQKTGRVDPVGQTPTEQTPRSFSIEPSGQFLFAAGQGSGKLAAFRINSASGVLTRIATYDVGERPWWVLAVKQPIPLLPRR
ncbi:MAG: lactonase family protein [Pirellulaceae bacterium]|nr:lactonase family protein [Pirellulaceae bacterium]